MPSMRADGSRHKFRADAELGGAVHEQVGTKKAHGDSAIEHGNEGATVRPRDCIDPHNEDSYRKGRAADH